MLSEHDLRTRLAEALHEQADPVTGDGIDAAGIFARAAPMRRRRRTAARATSVLAAAALLAGAWALRPGPAGPPGSPAPGYRPPGLLLAAAVVRPQPAPAADAGLPAYYVVADHNRPVAEIRGSATGKLLCRVPLPPGIDPKMSQVAAAGRVPSCSPSSPSRGPVSTCCTSAMAATPPGWPGCPCPRCRPGTTSPRSRSAPTGARSRSPFSWTAASAGRCRSCGWLPARSGRGPPPGQGRRPRCRGPVTSWDSSGRTASRRRRACGRWTPPPLAAT